MFMAAILAGVWMACGLLAFILVWRRTVCDSLLGCMFQLFAAVILGYVALLAVVTNNETDIEPE